MQHNFKFVRDFDIPESVLCWYGFYNLYNRLSLHDARYAIDSRKLQAELGWEPSFQFEEGIEKTVKWYLENEAWMDNITSGEYEKYYESMYANR